MSFKYREMRGWSDSFINPLIVTALENALRAAPKPLSKHPFRYIPCKNANTVFTFAIEGSVFLDVAYMTHRLSIDSYRLLVVVLHESVITLAIYGGILVFRNACQITEWSTISFLGRMGVALICSMTKSRCLVGVAQGSLPVILPSWETKLVFSTMV